MPKYYYSGFYNNHKFNVYKEMLNPTFASFKSAKPAYQHGPSLNEINLNVQPKTFYEIKASNNANKIMPENSWTGQHYQNEKISFSNNNQVKKPIINFNMKKNYSQASFLQPDLKGSQPDDIHKSKPKITPKNYVTAKKNHVQAERLSKEKSISRPMITGPSLLKNRSFIYTSKHQGKQNFMHRPSHDGYKMPYMFSEETSIDSIQRKSEDATISLGSSNGDKDNYSFFNSSKLQGSLNLRESCNSGRLQKTLNFSRKSNRTIYKGDDRKLKKECFPQASSLCSMARQLQSSFEEQNNCSQSIKSPQYSSINFSKKFQHYKRPKQNIQNRPLTIDQFQLLQEMGQGKYGKVYLAKHKISGFICAIKTISKAKIKQQNIQEPLIREIKIQMYLNHPNIVKLYGFFHDKQNLYLIMECCLEGHLLKLIKQRKVFEESQILEIITNVFEAVSFLHCHGIIHRDLKPQNIVIQHGIYKLCDFGWAAYAKGDMRTTFCGTPLYVCPQVLKGSEYDAKADVWGLGVLTYELAYGRVPFPIWNQSDMMKIVKDPVYFPAWTSISQKMQNLIKLMLNKDPTKRLSLNQIMSSSLITQYVGTHFGLKSQIEHLF